MKWSTKQELSKFVNLEAWKSRLSDYKHFAFITCKYLAKLTRIENNIEKVVVVVVDDAIVVDVVVQVA